MGTINNVTCIRFEEHAVTMAVIDPVSAMVTWQRAIAVDFPLLTRSGAVADPVRTGSLLQNTVTTFKLPTTVRVAVHLNHLELKVLTLPNMPEGELRQVIRDEAARESIFSYSGDPVVVAYQALEPSGNETPGKNQYLTAVTPGEVVDSLLVTMKQADLKLLSIQPTLSGLSRLMAERYPESGACRALLYVMASSAEFYLWQGSAPLFWRYLTAGADQPEKLGQEVLVSLEHSRRRTANAQSVRNLTVMGQAFEPVLEPDWSVEVLSGNKGFDLRGLGLQPKNSMNLNFITPSSDEKTRFNGIWQGLAALLIVGSLFLNAFLGWTLFSAYHALTTQKASVTAAKVELAQLQTMAAMTANIQPPTPLLPAGLQPDNLLEEFRRIIPSDMRFSSLTLDTNAKNMQITGICLEHDHLKEFLVLASNLKAVKALEVIETRQEGNGFYRFKLNLTLGVTKP